MSTRPQDRQPWTAAEVADALALPLAGIEARCRARASFFAGAWQGQDGGWLLPARSVAALLALSGSGPLLTLAEAADWLGVSRATLHRHRHRLPVFELLPGVVRVDASRLIGLLSGKPKKASGPIRGARACSQKGEGRGAAGALSGSGALSFPVQLAAGGGAGGSAAGGGRAKSREGGGLRAGAAREHPISIQPEKFSDK